MLTDGDGARATKLLEEIELTSRTPFIAIHAGSATTILAQAKPLAERECAELIRLMRELPQEIVLLEGPDEEGVAADIMRRDREAKAQG